MQSGTILHIALLKKLCSNVPECNYSNKFVRFRNNIRGRTANVPTRSDQSVLNFTKYSSIQGKYGRCPRTSRSNRSCRPSRSENQIKASRLQEHFCGWSTQNEEGFDSLIKGGGKKDRGKFLKVEQQQQEQQKRERGQVFKNNNHHQVPRINKAKLKQINITFSFGQHSTAQPFQKSFNPSRNKQNFDIASKYKKSKEFTRTPKKLSGEIGIQTISDRW